MIGCDVKVGSDGMKLWGTWQALVRLLPQLKKQGHRPLIFSQWTNMLDILEWALAVMGFRFTRLDGRYRMLCSFLAFFVRFVACRAHVKSIRCEVDDVGGAMSSRFQLGKVGREGLVG